ARRHEGLRTTLHWNGSALVQNVGSAAAPELTVDDLRRIEAGVREAAVRSTLEAAALAALGVEGRAPRRLRRLRLRDQEHVLIVSMHHVASDGWSMKVLVDELAQAYAATCTGTLPQLAELPLQYADYGRWQEAWMDSEHAERQLAYWKRKLC